MTIYEIILISLGLAMDAFAASISKGICIRKIKIKESLIIAFFFGFFQFFMPILGSFLGKRFLDIISNFDYILSFILLGGVGLKMIVETLTKSDFECCNIISFSYTNIIFLSIITSLDALAVGLAFSFNDEKIIILAIFIGIITFSLSYIGIYIGKKFGNKYEKKAEIFGGIILILIGFKIFIEHFI